MMKHTPARQKVQQPPTPDMAGRPCLRNLIFYVLGILTAVIFLHCMYPTIFSDQHAHLMTSEHQQSNEQNDVSPLNHELQKKGNIVSTMPTDVERNDGSTDSYKNSASVPRKDEESTTEYVESETNSQSEVVNQNHSEVDEKQSKKSSFKALEKLTKEMLEVTNQNQLLPSKIPQTDAYQPSTDKMAEYLSKLTEFVGKITSSKNPKQTLASIKRGELYQDLFPDFKRNVEEQVEKEQN